MVDAGHKGALRQAQRYFPVWGWGPLAQEKNGGPRDGTHATYLGRRFSGVALRIGIRGARWRCRVSRQRGDDLIQIRTEISEACRLVSIRLTN
jgi:hypothetical protein